MKKRDGIYMAVIIIPGIIAMILSLLKIPGVISIPWIWVLAPIWIPIGVMFILMLGFITIDIVIYLYKWIRRVK